MSVVLAEYRVARDSVRIHTWSSLEDGLVFDLEEAIADIKRLCNLSDAVRERTRGYRVHNIFDGIQSDPAYWLVAVELLRKAACDSKRKLTDLQFEMIVGFVHMIDANLGYLVNPGDPAREVAAQKLAQLRQ